MKYFFKYLKLYFKEHKSTVIITILSIVAIFIIIFVLRNDLKYEKGTTSLNFISYEHDLNTLRIHTKYIKPNQDVMTVFICIDNSADSDYVFSTTKNIQLINYKSEKVSVHSTDENYYYTINQNTLDKCRLLKFEGNLYSNNIYDKFLELDINTLNIRDESKLYISYENINLENIYPEESIDTKGFIKGYDINNTFISQNTQYYLQGFDQNMLHDSQLKSFDLGILIGILLSIITGVIIDFSFFYDRSCRNRNIDDL